MLTFKSCLVSRPHYLPGQGVSGHVVQGKMFPARLPWVHELTEKAWENTVQGLGKFKRITSKNEGATLGAVGRGYSPIKVTGVLVVHLRGLN